MQTRRNSTKVCLTLACASVAVTSGCFEKRPASAKTARVISFEHPLVPAATKAVLEPPPDIPLEQPFHFSPLANGHNAPPKPRVATTAAPDHASAEKTAEPTIVPELTQSELATAKTQTLQNLDQAERRLSQLSGRSLNAAQADLASKVRGFADGAREAMKSGDWARARNLSKKAVVLAEELSAGL